MPPEDTNAEPSTDRQEANTKAVEAQRKEREDRKMRGYGPSLVDTVNPIREEEIREPQEKKQPLLKVDPKDPLPGEDPQAPKMDPTVQAADATTTLTVQEPVQPAPPAA